MSEEAASSEKAFVEAAPKVVMGGRSIVRKIRESGDECDDGDLVREIDRLLTALDDATEHSSRAEVIGLGSSAVDLLIFAVKRYGGTDAAEELKTVVFGWVGILDKDGLVDLFFRVVDLDGASGQ